MQNKILPHVGATVVVVVDVEVYVPDASRLRRRFAPVV